MTKIPIKNLGYNYCRIGKGLPLILLHGFTGSCHSWNEFAGFFCSQIESVAIDLPGHGQTESFKNPERYKIEHTAEDIIAIADHLDLEHFSLMGYSMGGRLALFLAVNYPERINALILESTSPGIADPTKRRQRQEWDYAVADRIEREGITSFVDWWEQLPLFATQAVIPEARRANLRQERLNNNVMGLANSLRSMGTGSQPSLWDALNDLKIPTLLICGELDEKFVAVNHGMANIIPRAKLVIVGGTGHNIHFENPEGFASVLVNFCTRIDPD
jgi:2-succinyl-6-hydroxy-2,4-cyclohexadiene-1-carboxylate synthase